MTVHNRRETTLKCLRHLKNMIYDRGKLNLDVFMTDDGCSDGTVEAVNRDFPDVTVIHGNGELFWNRGMYAAWQKAENNDYDFYWWVNDDTFVFEDTISRLLDFSRSHQHKVLVVGRTCSSMDKERVTYGGYKGRVFLTNIDQEQDSDTINGNLVLVPRSVYTVIGKNDPYYRHSLGDSDYGLRALEAGISVLLAPGIFGICDLHEKPAKWKDSRLPIKIRWDNFCSPTGNNPFEFFHYKKRHFGIIPATGTFITNFLHFLFPRFWNNS